MIKISKFNAPIQNIKNPVTIGLPELFSSIKQDINIKNTVLSLRSYESKKERDEFKTQMLPVITFSGEFEIRKQEGLIKHSGLICADIDQLNVEQMAITKNALEEIKHSLVGYFISPSGRGYKVIMKVDFKEYTQADNYLAALNYLQSCILIPAANFDSVCKDAARACFISHDQDAYLNDVVLDDSAFINFPPVDTKKWLPKKQEEAHLPKGNFIAFNPSLRNANLDFDHKDDRSNFHILLSIASQSKGDYSAGNRHSFIQSFSSIANQFGMGKEVLKTYCREYFKDHPETRLVGNAFHINDELIPIVDDTYKRYKDQFQSWKEKEITEEMTTPCFPANLYQTLPSLLAKPLSLFDAGRDADVFLMGMLGVLSNWLPKIGGIYDNKLIGANLFVVISAPASSGKGTLVWPRRLASEVIKELKHRFTKAMDIYEQEMQQYDDDKKGGQEATKPTKPLKEKFIIAGNISSAALMTAIQGNNHFGLLYETEADTLVNTLNNREWGGFNDILRKAFHHECISSSRKKDNEEIEIERPYISMVLSGTPNQIIKLVSSIENGFFSRILYYDFPNKNIWKNVFEKKTENLDNYFEGYATKLEGLFAPFFYDKAEHNDDVVLFSFTEEQQEQFNQWFAEKQEDLTHIYGDDITASVRRLGICFFRVAMILSTLRLIEDHGYDSYVYTRAKTIECSTIDYNNAELIINSLIYHTIKVFKQVKGRHRNKHSQSKKALFLEKLPQDFTRAKAMELASFIGIKEKTAENYLSVFIDSGDLERVEHNHYKKMV